MIAANIWDDILSRVQAKVNRHSFYTWFKPTAFVGDDGRNVTVRVPNALFKDWITKHYWGVIAEALEEIERSDALVNFVASGTAAAEIPPPPAPPAEPSADAVGDQLSTPAPTTSAAGLNPRYTFDSFIVGSSNQFAHAACRAVAEAPSRSYNPLFIYGGVGLGKTHLMHAIGHYVLQHDRNLVLTYISSERFMNEMINAVRYDRLIDFRERYRSVDVLLVDDVQFLAGKERIQEEFFHTFNDLFESQKQIVISSDRPVSEIATLEARLVSRFQWGLSADIQSPDFETRVAILKTKAATLKVELPMPVIEFMAQHISKNIRRLEGALIKISSYAALTGKPLDLATAEHLLKDVLMEEAQNRLNIEGIQKRVADHYQIRHSDMTSKRRPNAIAFPRQIAMYLCRQLTRHSLQEIGEAFGGRDHGTVIHAVKTVENMMEQDDSVRGSVDFLKTQLSK
jgi:chromosomal replication initiator protein